MSMFYNQDKNILYFVVPNSEAAISAQHHGIVDRTVGSYYMSENYDQCVEFLNNFEGDFYIDISLTLHNVKEIIKTLKSKNYENAFKRKLDLQESNIKVLEWLLEQKEYFYKMKAPTINDKRKYLKLDNEDDVVSSFKTLLLGDLCTLYIKKMGNNGFVFYIDKNDNFDEILNSNKVLSWMN